MLLTFIIVLLLTFGFEDGSAGSRYHLLLPLFGALAMGILGLLDDWRTLPVFTRMSATVAIAAVFAFYGFSDSLQLFSLTIVGWPARLLQILWLVSCINFFNFMDGMDGLAGLQAWWISIGLVALSILCRSNSSFQADSGAIMQLYLILAALIAGYIFWNLPPAQLFMGDSGSYFLGFLLSWPALLEPLESALAQGDQGEECLNMGAMILLWLPMLLDTNSTLIWRLSKRKNIFAAHKEHLYQLLLQRGWRVRQILWLYFGFNLLTLPSLALLLLLQNILYSLIATLLVILLFVSFTFWLRYKQEL